MAFIIKMAQVESIDDEFVAGRIKARMEEDIGIPLKDLPWAFPLLPKTFQSVPKVGECVLVLNSEVSNTKSNRYYIGPVISQPQMMEKDPYIYGLGTAVSALQGAMLPLQESIDHYSGDTMGAFPPKDSVSILGRVSEDIILKDSEIDIRCGIRGRATNSKELLGKVVFNTVNPTYIQLKSKSNGIGYINCVAENINLVSPSTNFNGDVTTTDQNELIPTAQYDNMVSQLHQVPYGDVLVSYLKTLRSALCNHVHPISGKPPCKSNGIPKSRALDFNKLLSNTVRIS